MPISPEFKPLYGHTWRTQTRPRIIKRAGGRCERCRCTPWRIEVAHLDGDPRNMSDENLAALCGICHKRHDYPQWATKTRMTRGARKDKGRPLLRDL